MLNDPTRPWCAECGGAHEPSGARSDCITHWKRRAVEAENAVLVAKIYKPDMADGVASALIDDLRTQRNEWRTRCEAVRPILEGCMTDTIFYAEQICQAKSEGRREGWERMERANKWLADTFNVKMNPEWLRMVAEQDRGDKPA